jgi:antitoxin VapB
MAHRERLSARCLSRQAVLEDGMTMTLPADPETKRLAHALAAAKGRPVAVIVREAIAASARDAGVLPAAPRRSPAEKRQRLLEISERSAARPVLDARDPDEIIGYDDAGLPR